MSLLIVKKPGVKLHKEKVFMQSYYVAFAYAKDGKIYTRKFKNNNEEAYLELEKLTDYPAIIYCHFDKRKLFEKNIENLAPFKIDKDLVYLTVGEILKIGDEKDKKNFSGEFYFRDYALAPMIKTCPDLFFKEAGKWLMTKFLNSCSSIAFIKSNGDVSIMNEDKGVYENGLWVFTDKKKRMSLWPQRDKKRCLTNF